MLLSAAATFPLACRGESASAQEIDSQVCTLSREYLEFFEVLIIINRLRPGKFEGGMVEQLIVIKDAVMKRTHLRTCLQTLAKSLESS